MIQELCVNTTELYITERSFAENNKWISASRSQLLNILADCWVTCSLLLCYSLGFIVLGQNPAISELFSLLPQTAHCKFPGHPLVLFVVVVFFYSLSLLSLFFMVDGRVGRAVLVGRSDEHIVICRVIWRAIFCAIAHILKTFLTIFLTTFLMIFLTILQFL